jgi:hypothetical protein
LTPAQLEKLRETGIRLDRHGRFWHEGVEVTHTGMRRALLRWLDRRESDGRPILRMDGGRYAYVDGEDADLLVLSVAWRGDRAHVVLNDGATEELQYETLSVGDGDALYCRVRNGRLVGRLTTKAHYALAEHIEEMSDGSFSLCANGALHPIRPR